MNNIKHEINIHGCDVLSKRTTAQKKAQKKYRQTEKGKKSNEKSKP
jgi:hypothetical protein